MEQEEKHIRRPHYTGKYPKQFNEKYKELNPEKYTELAEHVREKGNTPAGTHIPICVGEILRILNIKPGENGLDCTLGYGGHTTEMLRKLSGSGHLTSLDIDPIESAKTTQRIRNLGYGEDIFAVRNINFAQITEVSREFGRFDFILADLGVSSMQIDNPQRGFTWKYDGPLDLRLNPTAGITAAQRLKEMTLGELEGMLTENADEPYAYEIAEEILKAERKGGIRTTFELRDVIERAVTAAGNLSREERKQEIRKSCQRTFQALRIDVNQEFEVLEQLVSSLPSVLNPGGRAAILTFHSGEDRIVKKLFKEGQSAGIYRMISTDVIRPSAEECRRNPRASSAKLRYAVRS